MTTTDTNRSLVDRLTEIHSTMSEGIESITHVPPGQEDLLEGIRELCEVTSLAKAELLLRSAEIERLREERQQDLTDARWILRNVEGIRDGIGDEGEAASMPHAVFNVGLAVTRLQTMIEAMTGKPLAADNAGRSES